MYIIKYEVCMSWPSVYEQKHTFSIGRLLKSICTILFKIFHCVIYECSFFWSLDVLSWTTIISAILFEIIICFIFTSTIRVNYHLIHFIMCLFLQSKLFIYNKLLSYYIFRPLFLLITIYVVSKLIRLINNKIQKSQNTISLCFQHYFFEHL